MTSTTPLLKEQIGRSPAVRLAAPQLIFSGDNATTVTLEPAGDGFHFSAPSGSAAEGLRVSFTPSESADGVALEVCLESAVALRGVQLVLPLELGLGWKSYVIAPGAIYNGNRFVVSPQRYAPYLLTEGVTPDGPIVVADIPRLSADTGYRTELAANAFAIPAAGVFDPQQRMGCLVGFDIYGDWGVSGVNLVTLPGEAVRVELCLPVMRKRRYRFCDWEDVTNEPGMNLEPGKPLRFHARLMPVPADTIPAFIHRVALHGDTCVGSAPRPRSLSFADAAERIEAKQDAHNWNERNGYYQSSLGDKGWILQTGWVGGGVTMAAMAMSENPERRRRAVRMLDTLCRNAVTPSGYFHGMHNGERWLSFGGKRPGCRAFSLIRRPLECTRDVLKVLELLRERGEKIDPVWEAAAKGNLEAMVSTAERFGHLGYTVDFDTGDVLWGDSACGSFGIEPLVRGAAWFKEPRYLETARKLADYYGTHFLDRGYTCGGVGDALMAADTESNYALLAGLVHLHRATGEARWLERAVQAADLFATWVLRYDAKLPAVSPLGRIGIQARGAVFANTQNQHGAPGVCTASCNALLLLHEATGEDRFLHMLVDIAGCISQMIVRPGDESIWPRLPDGSISERLMTMDGMCPIGHTASLSTWSEISMLLTARELPAVYQSPVTGTKVAFDPCAAPMNSTTA